MAERTLQVGEPAPWFVCNSPVNPRFHFDVVAGQYIALCFFGSAADPGSRRVLEDVLANRRLFDGDRVSFFGVSTDADDQAAGRLPSPQPGIHCLWDFDRAVSRLYGVAGSEGQGSPGRYRRVTFVLDERMRLLAAFPFGDNPEKHVAQVTDYLRTLPEITRDTATAPVLVVPRVFEDGLCRALMEYYESHGGKQSGFMREDKGMTVHKVDARHKQRRDQDIRDNTLRTATMHRIHDRLAPEIQKAFQFQATRIERYIVACYESETGGHFNPHRDNTTKGTAHRRFAVSLNLNSEFEGGDLRFPEFGRRTYRAPVGGAVVFSCSLLHEATVITQGKRYAFLPFLYDEAAAKIRQENLKFVSTRSPR